MIAGVDAAPDAGYARGAHHRRLLILRDSWVEALRHLRAMPRSPELLVYAAVQPVMFVVMFVYVFGGAIMVPDYDDYKQFLIPGIFAQTVLWGSAFTGVGLAEDLTKGIVDRLRSCRSRRVQS